MVLNNWTVYTCDLSKYWSNKYYTKINYSTTDTIWHLYFSFIFSFSLYCSFDFIDICSSLLLFFWSKRIVYWSRLPNLSCSYHSKMKSQDEIHLYLNAAGDTFAMKNLGSNTVIVNLSYCFFLTKFFFQMFYHSK